MIPNAHLTKTSICSLRKRALGFLVDGNSFERMLQRVIIHRVTGKSVEGQRLSERRKGKMTKVAFFKGMREGYHRRRVMP